jgi:uncharacterized protein (TIGR02145 family)
MNFRKIIYISALILAAIACKKEEETSVSPSLEGTLMIEGLPEFVAPGQVITLTPKGAKHPEGRKIEYSWKVSPSMPKYDTMNVFKHTFSDTLRTYTVYCSAFAEGYATASAVTYTTAVAPGPNGSIQGIKFKDIAEDSVYVRHMPYYYKTFGTQTWTINNMAVRSGIPFRNADLMSEVFGRYYNYNEAKDACDSLDTATHNWELPSAADWDALASYISGDPTNGLTVTAAMMAPAKFNGTAMYDYWPVVGEITNGSGFSALTSGYANTESKSFRGEQEYAVFWTADEATESEGYYKYLIVDQPGLFTGKGNKASFGASVRCIRK